MAGKESKTHEKIKFAFSYRMLKPDENSPVEYSFEEIRAKYYNMRYEMEDKLEAKYKTELEEKNARIKELEEQLMVMEQSSRNQKG